jgi:hypothetical protein
LVLFAFIALHLLPTYHKGLWLVCLQIKRSGRERTMRS